MQEDASAREQLIPTPCKFDGPTSLIGVQAVAVTNMVPKTIAGITSEAMLLAADVDGVPFWLTPNGQVPDGTLIK